MFSERTSAVGQRKALEEALDFAREGDAIVVTKLDRLARSVADLVRIVERLTKKGVGLRILAMGVDTATPTGNLVLNVLGAIGQFEREVMLERPSASALASPRSIACWRRPRPARLRQTRCRWRWCATPAS
jgi:DNA invertase Pin-like site-specific DNA recombinase